MSHLIKKRSKKSGLLPGTLVHIGENTGRDATISVVAYDQSGLFESALKSADDYLPLKDKYAVSWINVEGLHRADIIQKLGDIFSLHPLVQEDILNTDQRPKIEDYGEYIYIVLKMLHREDGPGFIHEQLSIILGRNFVISFQEGIKGDAFDLIRERIRGGKGKIKVLGADYLVYSLVDAIVDNYFFVIEALGEKIEKLEEDLVKNPQSPTLQKIHDFKKEIIFLRKAVWPLREVLNTLDRKESLLVKESTSIYLKDVYDHTLQITDTIESYREMLSGMLEIYFSSISHRMNEVMKFLTIIGTIFIPLTFIVGIYGMNFDFMPELRWRYGYFTILFLMFSAAVLMLFSREEKWKTIFYENSLLFPTQMVGFYTMKKPNTLSSMIIFDGNQGRMLEL